MHAAQSLDNILLHVQYNITHIILHPCMQATVHLTGYSVGMGTNLASRTLAVADLGVVRWVQTNPPWALQPES